VTKTKRKRNENDIPCCDWPRKKAVELSTNHRRVYRFRFVFVSFSFRFRRRLSVTLSYTVQSPCQMVAFAPCPFSLSQLVDSRTALVWRNLSVSKRCTFLFPTSRLIRPSISRKSINEKQVARTNMVQYFSEEQMPPFGTGTELCSTRSVFFRCSSTFDGRHSLNRFPFAGSVTQQENETERCDSLDRKATAFCVP